MGKRSALWVHTLMMPVSSSTYIFSVSTRSVKGLVFLGLASEGEGGAGAITPTGDMGVIGCTERPVFRSK